MRIGFITQWWPPEVMPLARSLAGEFTASGHDLTVLTGFPNYPTGTLFPGYPLRWRRLDTVDGIKTVRVPLYPSHDRSAIRRIANFTSFAAAATLIGAPHLRDVDVAYVYHPPLTAALPAIALRALRNIPFVLHVQDMWPESVTQSGFVNNRRVNDAIERVLSRACLAVYSRAAHIVVISPGFKQLLVERGVPADKITIVHNWADESVFRPARADTAARAELGPPHHRIVLYAGNFGDFQGLEDAILAAENVGRERPFSLALVGDGIARRRLEQLVHDRKIDNVRLLPARPSHELTRLLSAADAHLVKLQDLPFFTATIPSKTQVAMASAKALVMAVRGDAADIVQKAECGVTCEPSVEGLGEAFDLLARVPDYAIQALGESGYDYYMNNFSLERSAGQIAECLQQAADDRPRRRR